MQAVHDQFWLSYAPRDLHGRFTVRADDITLFGTGQHERAMNKELYRLMNQKGVEQFPKPFTIEPLRTEMTRSRSLATDRMNAAVGGRWFVP